jgi:NAD(P)-dependent dehydrogenase (short-subunit alcohol dehydrogenase family)
MHLRGRTVIVTGASDGIGAVTARELARAGARVVLAVRNPEKALAASRSWGGDTEVRRLDLSRLHSVRAFAADWHGEIDVLINSAGVLHAVETRTHDGFEAHIGVNHLGHFALTQLLLPRITGRVVTVSSDLHKRARLDVDDLNWERRPFNAVQAYSDSKLANLLFTYELQRRLTESGSPVLSVAAHPGISKTNLVAHGGDLQVRLLRAMLQLFAQDADGGARPTLYAATQPLPGAIYVGPSGFMQLRGPARPVTGSAASRDATLAARLWERSAELTGVDVLAASRAGTAVEMSV